MKPSTLKVIIIGMIFILAIGFVYVLHTESYVTRKVVQEYGIWIWETPGKMSETYVDEAIGTAKEYSFNTLYITIDDYVAISTLTDEKEKAQQKDQYFETLLGIIQKAHAHDIAVDVVGGARDWAYPENRWKGYVLIDFVKEYNDTYPEAKIRGLQYDVEPYLLPEYDEDKEKPLQQFLEFIDESVMRMKDVDASFSIVIPHFYDATQKWTPSIEYAGKREYTFTHLLKILEKKPGSMIIIMAYRNFFEGDDGVGQLTEAEIREASDGGYATRIIVAQETGDVEPSYVTFFGKSKAGLQVSVDAIRKAYSMSKNFGGVSIHYLEPFMELK
jgi:hypothetical protein